MSSPLRKEDAQLSERRFSLLNPVDARCANADRERRFHVQWLIVEEQDRRGLAPQRPLCTVCGKLIPEGELHYRAGIAWFHLKCHEKRADAAPSVAARWPVWSPTVVLVRKGRARRPLAPAQRGNTQGVSCSLEPEHYYLAA